MLLPLCLEPMHRPTTRELARLSRDRSFLVRIGIWITAGSIVLGWILSLLPLKEKGWLGSGTHIQELMDQWSETQGRGEPESVQDWLDMIRFGQILGGGIHTSDCTWIEFPRSNEPAELPEIEIEEENTDPETLNSLEIFQESLSSGALERGIEKLESISESTPFRNEMLGDLQFLSENYPAATRYYQTEVETRSNDAAYAARSAIMAAWRGLEREQISSLLRKAPYSEQFSAGEKLRIFTDARDYRGMAIATVQFEVRSFLKIGAIPSFGIAVIWFLILMPFWEVSRVRVIAALVAFCLGIVSASLTLFFVLVQERIQGFDLDLGVAPFAQFLYFTAGVGLREETLKLVCFLPVAIWAVKRKSDIEGMMLAAMVGLGFAFKENILYLDSGLTSYLGWVRFLTANALHLSLTGIAGFYLFRMLRRKGHGWEEFLASFIAVVVAHGIYNSILAMPSLASYAALSPILIAIIAYRFFDPLRSTMDTVGVGHRISPLGVFVLGSIILTCLVLLTSSLQVPYRSALGAFLASVGGMVPLAFAFISRFRDL